MIIFLDIDGVLYSHEFEDVRKLVEEKYKLKGTVPPNPYPNADCDEAAVELFNKTALANLDTLIKRIKESGYTPSIVLSSSWRSKGPDSEFFRKLFSKHSFSQYILDKTIDERREDVSKPDPLADIRGDRALEIKYWLDTNSSKLNVKDYLILDDIVDIKKKHGKKCIVCDQQNDLFSEEAMNEALDSLGIDNPIAPQHG